MKEILRCSQGWIVIWQITKWVEANKGMVFTNHNTVRNRD